MVKQLKKYGTFAPLESDKTPGKCIYTGKPSAQRVIFAIAY